MQLTLVRNATLILSYAGQRLLIDPFFAEKHALPSFTGNAQNPTVGLPMPIENIIDGTTAVFVTHLHRDHWDPAAQESLNKALPIFCQPENDTAIQEASFSDVTVITDSLTWSGISITRTGGHHGLGAVEALMGTVSGFVLAAEGEPTVYIAGDTVMCKEVHEAIATHKPDIIITNSGGAMWQDPENDSKKVFILKNTAETLQTAQLAPQSRVIAVHIESLDHCTVTRQALRQAADSAGISSDRLMIPADGETLDLGTP